MLLDLAFKNMMAYPVTDHSVVMIITLKVGKSTADVRISN